jgi:hypothetical protein
MNMKNHEAPFWVQQIHPYYPIPIWKLCDNGELWVLMMNGQQYQQ